MFRTFTTSGFPKNKVGRTEDEGMTGVDSVSRN